MGQQLVHFVAATLSGTCIDFPQEYFVVIAVIAIFYIVQRKLFDKWFTTGFCVSIFILLFILDLSFSFLFLFFLFLILTVLTLKAVPSQGSAIKVLLIKGNFNSIYITFNIEDIFLT